MSRPHQPLSLYVKKPNRSPLSKGFSRYSLNFTGVAADYISVPDLTPPNLNEFTIIIWFYMTGRVGAWRGLFGDWGLGAAWAFISHIDFTNVLAFSINGNNPVSCVSTVLFDAAQLNRWYSLAMVYDRPNMEYRLLLNGVRDVTTPLIAANPVSLTSLRIGKSYDDSRLFLGRADEFLFYDRALLDREVMYSTLNYNEPIKEGLRVWYRMEEGRGGTVYDRSGAGNHGTIFGATWHENSKWELRAEAEL